MGFELWDYQLLAADGVPQNMYLSPDFVTYGWPMLTRRAAEAKRLAAAAGGTLKGVVYKYPSGQNAEQPKEQADGSFGPSQYSPLPLLSQGAALRDEARRRLGRSDRDPQLWHLVDTMARRAHAMRLSRMGLKMICYEGSVGPDDMPGQEQIEAIATSYRLLEHQFMPVTGPGGGVEVRIGPSQLWSPIMAIDSACYAADGRDQACWLLRQRLMLLGVADVFGEAFPEPGSIWDQAGVTTLGEDAAWRAAGGSEALSQLNCRCGLLSVGGADGGGDDAAIDAAGGGHLVALNIALTDAAVLRRVVEAGKGGIS